MRVVAFSGKGGSGKTTAAQHAINMAGGTKVALGDAVKEEVAEFLDTCLVPYEGRHLWGSQADRAETFEVQVGDWLQTDYRVRRVLNPHTLFTNTVSMTYRKLLQIWGTEYRRAQKESYWCDKGREKILAAPEGYVFVDDIRFPDEAEMIHDLGGILIRIERPGGPFIENHDHPSETSLDNYNMFNMTIFNGGSLDDFKAEIGRVMAWLG